MSDTMQFDVRRLFGTKHTNSTTRGTIGEQLPSVHRDPFDRLLVAQARVEGLSLLTSDPVFERYGVPIIAA